VIMISRQSTFLVRTTTLTFHNPFIGRGPLLSPTLDRPMVKHRPPTRKASPKEQEDTRSPRKKNRSSFLKIFSPSNSPIISPAERKEPKITRSPSELSRRLSLPSSLAAEIPVTKLNQNVPNLTKGDEPR
jgi:hypothetical protein